ncbi:succinate dehydrogenase cytochrome b560 subunit, mitochondrial-like [Patiria miniata]|uniref:Succinate dehydrogenase cytochrome b560 subunit, mitochondrial n=1 Tax=Patiria miniata TaxID=46514 RepID=A0A913ZAL0_PATMI|nr:succinate dehydrogenase cytochrome b560 subunit, mitochondrial-like [Patiria miniata]XP_038047941.1 succinate dehydrogenase cytochrome b560 subunit, mitochondrial-like [Patiria miniata]
MALTFRSVNCSQLLLRRLTPCMTKRVTATVSTWKDEQNKFLEKNATLKRPMSPHITIYSFPLTALLSGSHRFTGLGIYAGLAAFGVSVNLLPGDLASNLALVKSLSYGPALIFLTKLYVTWPFCYHYINGIRHMIWDTGRGMDLKSMYSTGYAVLGSSIVIALAIAML